MKIASAPDMMDDLNQLSLMLFNKPLKDLTDDEYDRLQEYAEEKLAMGGRVMKQTGGLTRTSYAMGKGPVLPSDEDPINPFQPKPIGPVLPDKSMMADLGDEFLSPE